MANALWMIRKTSTGTTLWKGNGAAPPEVVLDNAQLREAFTLSFPDILVEYGDGDFELMVVNVGMAQRVSSIAAYTLPGCARVADAESAALTRHTPGKEARVAADGVETMQEEATRVLNPSIKGMPPIKVQDGIPQPEAATPDESTPSLAEVSAPLPMNPLATESLAQCAKSMVTVTPDESDFTMLLRAVNRKVMLKEDTWAGRLRALPAIVGRDMEEVLKARESIGFTYAPIHGFKYVGAKRAVPTTLSLDIFSIEPSDKTTAYLNVIEAFEAIEDFDISGEDVEVISAATCYRLSCEMFWWATTLYLLEVGIKVTPEAVLAEMQCRADFVASKDAEYGQPIRRHGIPGVITRCFDKIARYTNLKGNPELLPRFESVVDSVKDLGGYSLILAGFFQETLIPELHQEASGPEEV